MSVERSVAQGSVDIVVGDIPVDLLPVTLLLGELNGDGIVDVLDIGGTAAVFNLVTADRTDGSRNIVDFNADGIVDVLDIAGTAENFLLTSPKTWPWNA